MRKLSPCKGCEERTEYGLCHDTCPKFKAYKDASLEEKNLEFKAKAGAKMVREHEIKTTRQRMRRRGKK